MEETKRRRFIIRAGLEGEVDVSDAPPGPVPEYPKTLTETDPGVDFGAFDITKNTNTPPYVANSNKSRIHCLGENALGYPITMGKTYRITVPAGSAYAVGIRSFNEDAVAQIEAVAAISAVNNYDSGWINFVDDTCTFTPRMINGKDPLCMWLGFKKTSNGLGNWTEVSDMMPVIITEEE